MIRKRTVKITIITTIFMTCLLAFSLYSSQHFTSLSLLLAYSPNFMVFFYPTTKSSICIFPWFVLPFAMIQIVLVMRLWCSLNLSAQPCVSLQIYSQNTHKCVTDWWGRGWVYNEWWMNGFSAWLYNRTEKMIIVLKISSSLHIFHYSLANNKQRR